MRNHLRQKWSWTPDETGMTDEDDAQNVVRHGGEAPMMRQQEMQHDIEYWVAEVGYTEVLEALISTCMYLATTGDQPPIEGPCELWAKRESTLRNAVWEASL